MGFEVQKWVQMWVKNDFCPTLNPFRDFRENPLFTQFKGVKIVFFKKALRSELLGNTSESLRQRHGPNGTC